MAEDEGRMLSPKEARVRRRIASIAKKDTPKNFVVIKPDELGRDLGSRKNYYKNNPNASRRFKGVAGTKVRGQVETSAGIEARYVPKQKTVRVTEMYPLKKGEKVFGDTSYPELHKQAGGEMFGLGATKNFVKKSAKIFPKANELIGPRVTGLRAELASKYASLHPEAYSTEAGAEIFNRIKTQHFDLNKLRNRMSKLGKAGKVLGLGLAAYDVVKNLNKE